MKAISSTKFTKIQKFWKIQRLMIGAFYLFSYLMEICIFKLETQNNFYLFLL